MERNKQMSRAQVLDAVERFLKRYGAQPIPVDALKDDWISSTLNASNEEGDLEAEVTHVEAVGAEEDNEGSHMDLGDMDLGDMVADAINADGGNSGSIPAELVEAFEASPSMAGFGVEEVPAESSSSARSVQVPVSASGSGNRSQASLPSSQGQGAGAEPLSLKPPAPPVVQASPVVTPEPPSAMATLARPKDPNQQPPLNPSLAPPDDVVPPVWGRYSVSTELARGGQGRILEAYDDVIGRNVALKILRREGMNETRLVHRFLVEAQITGQLEHPNIVTVHELGWIENGLPYYTMKKVEGRTLKKVIVQLRKGNPQIQQQYGRIKLLTILQQVCMAISFAHDRGVIHRDLKPANIMLGDYGEVIVLDWGVAKIRDIKESTDEAAPKAVRIRKGSATETQAGTVEGTPAYMAPEQARGRVNEIDERSDVYALGAILYEILTYRPPFRGQDVREVLRQVVEEVPLAPSLVAPQNQIPDELESIAMKCLAKAPKDRFVSVKALQEELEAFLEGTKRRMAAQQKVQEARELVRQHEELKRELLMARLVAQRAADGIQGWEPIERKRGVWVTRTRVQEIEAKIFVTFGEAVARFSQALAHEPENTEAREGLANLFIAQLKKSESEKDHAQVVYCESMIRQYGGANSAAFLKGDGLLTIETEPSGGEVWLYQYEETDRVLRPVNARRLGIAPVIDCKLPRGSYLLVIRAAGYRDVYFPVQIGRQESVRARIRMYTNAQIGDGFVYIPGASVKLGGDPDAIDALDNETRQVKNFAIQEYPVTFREYIEFLNAWLAVDPEEANRHLPQLEAGVPLVVATANGYEPVRELIGPEGRALGRPGMEYDVPVFGIDYDNADAYCAWRSEITGQEFRMPSEEEWERAARGADGRIFPWGNQFDPTFCKSRRSRPWAPEPEPIGSFPEDTSPCGVRDMAGGVREWCDGWFNESQGLRVLRGGAWVDSEVYLRCASRSFYDPYLTKRVAGFRCARSLP